MLQPRDLRMHHLATYCECSVAALHYSYGSLAAVPSLRSFFELSEQKKKLLLLSHPSQECLGVHELAWETQGIAEERLAVEPYNVPDVIW